MKPAVTGALFVRSFFQQFHATSPVVMPARVVVLAGVNGAGKSSIAGEAILSAGGEFYNPDSAAQELLESNPHPNLAQIKTAFTTSGTSPHLCRCGTYVAIIDAVQHAATIMAKGGK